ncbi:30S ribosomal protein S4 [Chlamydiota bacterium]
MARYVGPKCKLCRREGTKLMLKGVKCLAAKCTMEKRDYAPGQHGASRKKISNYGVQLREKQKLKRLYGMLEKQFKLTFEKASKMKGVTGDNLLMLLETRLDNVVFKAGLTTSRNAARQFIRHKHILVNNKRVDIPSFHVKEKDKIQVVDKERSKTLVKENIEAVKSLETPVWLRCNRKEATIEVLKIPERNEIAVPVQEQLVVELYSK